MISIEAAAKLLQAHTVVAFATETVYGLGARADSDLAVEKIYTLKGRPTYNPLIAHVASLDMLKTIALLPESLEGILARLWPAPLTVVLPQRPSAPLSPLATANLNTIAVRIPQHPLARTLIDAVGLPIVAPSANISSHVSPTTAAHVASAFPDTPIVDGGACEVGLESTILDLSTPTPTLLRQGGVVLETLSSYFSDIRIPSEDHALKTIKAPGQLKRHYAPSQPLRLNVQAPAPNETYIGFGKTSAHSPLNLSPRGDLEEAARNLFRVLREAESFSTPISIAPIPYHGIGAAINDRLKRAATPKHQDAL